MEVPIWLAVLAIVWKLANETAKIIIDYKIESRRLELGKKEEK